MEIVLNEEQQVNYSMSDLSQRKAFGLSYLEKNDFAQAVNVYKEILIDYPEDIESYLLLGDLYIANEDYPSAEKIYEKALILDPDNAIIQRRVKLSTFEVDRHALEEIPTDAASVSKILQNITGRVNPVSDDEIQNAAKILESIVHSNNPAEMVAQNLEKIDSLLPALIELNIRQARNDKRFDLVNMLQALQESISQQVVDSIKDPEKHNDFIDEGVKLSNRMILREAVILVPDLDSITDRVRNIVDTLTANSINVRFYNLNSPTSDKSPDIIIACNPHINPVIMEKMAYFSSQHIPILLDLDEDFEYMPINHPEYPIAGLGSLEKSRSFSASTLFANLITVPGESMAVHLRESGYKVEVVPFGWTSKNEQWLKPPSRRSSINIGLVGIQGNFEDVQRYRRIIIRVMREFPQTRFIVCGDSMTYKLFENISESRRVFLPSVPSEDMSYVLGQVDILLVPLNTTPYHLVTTDRLLMQAGVKSIPWIASPMPDFIRWQTGGVVADNPEEWHSYLRQFVIDGELRHTLGQAGKNHSMKREESEIGMRWLEVIKKMILNANYQK